MSNTKWLRSHVERCLQDVWDVCRVEKDDDGDYGFRNGTAQGYVRVEPGVPDLVRVFAYATLDIPRSARLLVELNDIDSRCRTVSLSWHGRTVIVEQVLHAKGLKRSSLRQAYDAVGFVANDVGTMLATVYGGSTPHELALICPVCSSADVHKILWGMPTEEGFRMAEEENMVLGGCCIDDSTHRCAQCNHTWAA